MDFAKVVKDELSGSAAKSFVAGVTRYHRIQAPPMMYGAAEHVMDELKSFGMDEARIERLPSDGRRKYWTHKTVVGWTVKGAELRLVEPGERSLAKFSDIPQSLHTFSKGTPKGGVTAELVDVGKGVSDKDYAGKKVKGKFVLATGRGTIVHREAVLKRGAAGVITDGLSYEFHGVRESTDIPDAHAYQGIWPTAAEAKKVKFGFSLSRRQGNELRRHLASGEPVRLHATVDAEFTSGSYSIVSASIRGSERPEDEIVLVAHLCHPKPGANDNASGSGLLMEMARTISHLIRSGKIQRPKRTIRFLWVPETTGSVAFLSKHPELHAGFKAAINLDMVGEDQTLCKSTLTMDSTPDSLPSYLNDLVFSMIERANTEYDPFVKIGMVSNFRYARTTHSGGSDHEEFNESTVGTPCVGLTQWPDMFYHTSLDTIEKVSEDSLRRVGFAAAVSALTLADAGPDEIHSMAVLTASEGMKRISDAVQKAHSDLLKAKEEGKDARAELEKTVIFNRMRVSKVASREVAAVRSLSKLDADAGSDAFVEHQAAAVSGHGSKELSRLNEVIDSVAGKDVTSAVARKAPSKAEAKAKKIVPKRRFKGSLDPGYLADVLGEKRCVWHDDVEKRDASFSKKQYEIVNLMDGERDLCEITEVISAQYGPTQIEDVLRFYSDLRSARLVE
ncbi:MAG: hypothetical protein QG582_258 [Candidatus Thermoplasmatota archaeon]|nr:hypothetical protein [Candidatus Thermoplasmatota archaeon]